MPGELISFVGAGPGAPDLLTLRGAKRLEAAAVVVWASSLVPEAVLSHASKDAVVYDSAGMTLEDVLDLYRRHRDDRIVRLHSGDPSVYGALQEQLDWCRAEGRPFEVVPGVSSLAAAAAALPHELTVPGVAQSVVLCRLAGRTAASVPASESVAAFSRHGTTMAVFLSAARPEELQAALLGDESAYGPDTPAAICVRASWPDGRVVRTTVGRLAEDLRGTGATRTTLVLVGEALREDPGGRPRRSRLYAPEFAHSFRRRSLPGTTTGRPARTRRGSR